jgi:hypothetical protein
MPILLTVIQKKSNRILDRHFRDAGKSGDQCRRHIAVRERPERDAQYEKHCQK